MHNDDRPVGRFLSRRELMALFGASAPVAAMSTSRAWRTRGYGLRSPQRPTASPSLNRPRGRTSWTSASSGPTSGWTRPRGGHSRCAARSASGRVAGDRDWRLRAAAGGAGGHLALRCRRRLLGRPGPQLRHDGTAIPARLPGHRRRRSRAIHDDLSRLVPRPRRAHSFQDPRAGGVRDAPTSSPRSSISPMN